MFFNASALNFAAKCFVMLGNMKATVYFAFAVYNNSAEVYKAGQRISGVYKINPDNGVPFDVLCDKKTASRGWTVFQKRINGSVDFYCGCRMTTSEASGI